MDTTYLTLKEARAGLLAKKFTSVELTEACLARIAELNGDLNAVLLTLEAEALEAAEEADARIAAGKTLGPLDGIPVLLKDNILVQGSLATAGSKILETYISAYDATVTAKLKAGGAVILGKTNMDEFAMGSSTENSAFGPTKNPWDQARVPGGSSGGSAAALASGMCLAALGSETGGSVRQPAALCGITGFKPTYGRVSRYGLMAMASSLDQVAPFARSAEDAAAVLSVIQGRDPHDSTSADESLYVSKPLKGEGLKGLRVGVPKEYFVAGMDEGVEAAVKEAMRTFEKLGAELVEVSLPSASYALAVYYVLMPCEASANLSRFDGIRYGFSAPGKTLKEVYLKSRGEGFGPEVRRRIMLGTYALSSGYYDAYYLQAQKVRTKMLKEYQAALTDADVLLSPTSPSTAWPIGEKFEDPLSMYLSDIYTVTANVVGAPAVSVPCGFSRDLPVGLQLMGRQFEDERVLEIARRYQEETEWHVKRPMI